MPEPPLLHRNKHLLLTNIFQVVLEELCEENKARVRFSVLHVINNEPSLAFKKLATSAVFHAEI